MSLCAESAANIGADHSHLILLKSVNFRDGIANGMRSLTADFKYQPTVFPPRNCAAILDRCRSEALIHRCLCDDNIAIIEGNRVAAMFCVHRDVCSDVWEQLD